jgi:hypothetical protein
MLGFGQSAFGSVISRPGSELVSSLMSVVDISNGGRVRVRVSQFMLLF